MVASNLPTPSSFSSLEVNDATESLDNVCPLSSSVTVVWQSGIETRRVFLYLFFEYTKIQKLWMYTGSQTGIPLMSLFLYNNM